MNAYRVYVRFDSNDPDWFAIHDVDADTEEEALEEIENRCPNAYSYEIIEECE